MFGFKRSEVNQKGLSFQSTILLKYLKKQSKFKRRLIDIYRYFIYFGRLIIVDIE
tara:strand:- start:2478 stop:2642 length:165 start_codon:yes stop_codon:yes gene_type:complete